MALSESFFILKNDGTLWGCGRNDCGQLGLGDTNNRNTFIQITTNANDAKTIYYGYHSVVMLKNDGTLWGSGRNVFGELGLGDTANRTTFTQVIANTNDIKSVCCGFYHTLILKNNGTLLGCGWNSHGQLGLGNTDDRNVFTQIAINTNDIKSVYGGGYHTFILKNDGTLWGCGRNDYGQLGLRDTTDRSVFTIIGINSGNIKEIYLGGGHTIILKNDGTLWGCGYNNHGQLGLGDTTNRTMLIQITTNADDIKSVYCSDCYTLILKNDGTLWGCGYNGYGQLGLGDTADRTTFTQITTNMNNIKSIYNGSNYISILKNDSTLWTCGHNGYSQLGLGDTTNRYTLTQITANVDNIKNFANDYNIPSIIKIYDLKIGYAETLDTNNFRNIPVDKFEKIKVLCANPVDTYLNCLISFDKKQTWKTFDGLNWNIISDISPENVILNGMELVKVSQLDKSKLTAGGFVGDLDFKIVMKTNDKTVTSSVTKIYIEYK